MTWLAAADFARLSAGLVLFGAALFPFYARALVPVRVLRWSAITACVFGAIATLLQAQKLDAGLPQLLATGIGRVWCAQIVLAALGVALSFRANSKLGLTLLAALNLVIGAFVGHANAIAGLRGAWVEALHMLAAGGWIGGLLVLLLHLRTNASSELVARFSRAGLVFVLVISGTGAGILLLVTGAALPMTDFAYGRLVTWKVALFAAALGLAAFNRFRAAPRSAWALLQRSIVLEIALLTVVIAVAVALAGTEPLA